MMAIYSKINSVVIAGAISIAGIAGVLYNIYTAQHKNNHDNTPVAIIPEEKTYEVVNVVDGDTIDINMDGKTQRIRLIGVNTPETVHPEKTVGCFGKEASNYTKERLSGKRVSIETDDSQDRYDTYNRLLAYVFIDGENFNLSLIKNGYAYEYTYNVPYKYQAEFKAAQKEAETNKNGLWADDACKEENSSTSNTNNQPKNNTENCKIKGNINSKGEKIYHVPGQKYYDSTKIDTSKGERWFCTEAEAQAAGWRKSKV